MANEDFFNKQREMVGQRAATAGRDQSDAIKRRFASLGASNSGAALKAEQLADQETQQGKEEALQGVAGQELAAKQQQQGQEFQAAEAEKGRSFQAKESEAQRGQQAQQFAQTLELDKQQLQFDREDQTFNKGLATLQAGVPLDFGDFLTRAGNFDVNKFRQDRR